MIFIVTPIKIENSTNHNLYLRLGTYDYQIRLLFHFHTIIGLVVEKLQSLTPAAIDTNI